MKIGQEVVIYLDDQIKKNKKNVSSSVLELWKNINGKRGIISKINGEEVWIKSRRTGKERKFDIYTLKQF